MARRRRSATTASTVSTVSAEQVPFRRPIEVLLESPKEVCGEVCGKAMDKWARKIQKLDHPLELITKSNIRAVGKDRDMHTLTDLAIAEIVQRTQEKVGMKRTVFITASTVKQIEKRNVYVYLGDVNLSKFLRIGPTTMALFYGTEGAGKTQTALLVSLASSVLPAQYIEIDGLRYGGYGGYAIYVDTERGTQETEKLAERVEEISEFIKASYESLGIELAKEPALWRAQIATAAQLIEFLTWQLPKVILEFWNLYKLAPTCVVIDTVVAGLRSEITQDAMVHRFDYLREIISAIRVLPDLGVPVIAITHGYEVVQAFIKAVHAYGGHILLQNTPALYEFKKISVKPSEGTFEYRIASVKGGKPAEIRVKISPSGYSAA